jgi:hypothetical protein
VPPDCPLHGSLYFWETILIQASMSPSGQWGSLPDSPAHTCWWSMGILHLSPGTMSESGVMTSFGLVYQGLPNVTMAFLLIITGLDTLSQGASNGSERPTLD